MTLAMLPLLLKDLCLFVTDHVAVGEPLELCVMGFHQLATVYVTLSLVCATRPFGSGGDCSLK